MMHYTTMRGHLQSRGGKIVAQHKKQLPENPGFVRFPAVTQNGWNVNFLVKETMGKPVKNAEKATVS